MQLAASQRAHPPPVPPRPSRQVVAEALKKSPRPPCPTRQAPPPPNQRPWRQEEQKQPENNNATGSGRTIVYESAHLANKPVPVVEAKDKLSEDSRRRSSVDKDKEKQKRPLSKDLSREQQANRPVNGKDHHQKELEVSKIDDTSKRKEELINDATNNNNNVDHGKEKDQCYGPILLSTKEVELEGSVERKKKKVHNVTFKGVQIPESASESNNKSPPLTPKKSTEKCETVVVIDKVEGPRVTSSSSSSQEESDNIQRQDWLEAGIRYSSTKITLPAEEVVVANGCSAQQPQEEDEKDGEVDNQLEECGDLDYSSIIERIAMSSLQGLPPLPRSLSGFNLNGAGLVVEPVPPPPARSTSKSQRAPKTPTSTSSLSSQGSRPSPQGRQLTTLDTQLAILRREMFGLRQLDLSLLSQLWSLNESIQEFRQLLQEQEDRAPSPSPSSEEGDDISYGGSSSTQQQPPPPPRRPAPTTPHHHLQQQQHHHHRPMRTAARCTKMPLSDDSPSSEEYGAV